MSSEKPKVSKNNKKPIKSKRGLLSKVFNYDEIKGG